jgi:CheY-like chemotaxis protein
LSIASQVSALLGGEITATSDLGRGSTFTLRVPTTLPDAPAFADGPDAAFASPADGAPGLAAGRPAGPDENAQPLRAAMADITRAATSLIQSVLVFEGTSGGLLTLLAYSAISDLGGVGSAVHVSTATSPGQGVALLAAGPFRCVVVDLAAPNAFDFLEQVQEKPGLRAIPVLAHLSGQPAGGERLAALRAGYRTLELLPSLDELRERITLHLSAAEPDPLAAARGRQDDHPELRGKHVLVIDDDARNVFAITSTLELHDVVVTRASDGRQGIEVLRGDPETDLILMDVMMPGMDGYATMTAIRQMPEFGSLPIIAVTARAMPSDREKSLAAGANDYVTKPVDTDELIACMERWLAYS